jgi:hypothetical protein
MRTKRKVLALTLVLALLFSAVAGAFFVKYTKANPYLSGEETAPPAGTEPPAITIPSPKDMTYESSTILLSFNISVGDTQPIPNATYTSAVTTWLSEVYYQADWLDENFTFPPSPTAQLGTYPRPSVEYSGFLSDIPQGRHSIVIYATESGWYESPISGSGYVYINRFNIRQSWVVNFTIAKPPEPFPTELAITASASLAFVSIGGLVYFKKRKH